MAMTSSKNGRAHVIEMANRATVQKLASENLSGLTSRLDNHESGLNTSAHGISNIAGLQTALNGKEPVFSKNTAFNKNFGTTAGTVVEGNKDIKVNTTGLANMTADHRIQVDGYVGHKVGWRDLVSPFTTSAPGAAAPTLQTLPNGIRMHRFGVGDSMHASYHVDHDYAEGTNAYHHIHWFPETAMPAGTTVTWRIFYLVAKGHNQGESMLVTRSQFDVTYTAPVGGTIAGDHIVTESSDAQSYSLKEPDTVILAEVQLLSKTFAGNVFGIQADLHYLSDREVTVSKKPNFNIA
jgi:hypothetical protein